MFAWDAPDEQDFNLHNDFIAFCANEGKMGTDESAQVLARKN